MRGTLRIYVEHPEHYAGQAEHVVDTDGRDWSAMEAMEFPATAAVTRVRFLGWNALTRAGITRRTWPEFNQQDCVDFDDLTPVEGGEDEQGLDPGQTTMNAPAGSMLPWLQDSLSSGHPA